MRVAFVNQPIDMIIPPYQSSVGACTYGAACSLAKSCEVIVYGTREWNANFPRDLESRNVHFHFFSTPLLDKLSAKAKDKYSRLFPLSAPASSSEKLFRHFGREVAEDLRLQACDVIHVQHCSQYLPILRAVNPSAKIVLHLHAEWFSQNQPAVLAKRLRHVDLVTTVSDYITAKTLQQFPMIAGRCETVYNAIDMTEFSRSRKQRVLPRPPKRILYTGAVSPHKGLHVLVDAFNILVKQHSHVQLNVVGLQTNYPLAENFEFSDRELIESILPFYTYNWAAK